MIWANHYQKIDDKPETGTQIILEDDIDYWTEGEKIELEPWEVIVVGFSDQTVESSALSRTGPR